jgi:nucleoside-diphosphate-sugar epimerase
MLPLSTPARPAGAPALTTILLTGATGFVGGALARRWATTGLPGTEHTAIHALVRDPASAPAQELAALGVRLVPGDLRDTAALAAACAGADVVVHAAADTVMSDRMTAWAVAVEGTRALYQAAAQAGVRRFIFISSLAVFAGTTGEVVESAPLVPSGDLYVDTKIAAEQALQEEAAAPGAPELTILRLAWVYGAGSANWTTKPIQDAQAGKLFIPGDGHLMFSYVYVDNVVDAVTAAIRAPHTGIYHIFDGSTTYKEFMSAYCAMAGTRPRRLPLPMVQVIAAGNDLYARLTGKYTALTPRTVRALSRKRPISSSSGEKAVRELGWHPQVTLHEGMERIARDFEAGA